MMGAWGTANFSDDTACDVRDTYEDLLLYGRTPEEAERQTIAELEMEVGDAEPTAWLALAATEWRCGRALSELVRSKAIEIIDGGADLERWESNKQKANRQKALDKLRAQLESPLPRPKKLKPLPTIHCPWQIGDVLAVRMPSKEKYPTTSDLYALLHVADINKIKYSKYAPDDKFPISRSS